MRRPRSGKQGTQAGNKANFRGEVPPAQMVKGQRVPMRHRPPGGLNTRRRSNPKTHKPYIATTPDGKRPTQTSHTLIDGPFTPVVRKDQRGKVIDPIGSNVIAEKNFGLKIVCGWFSGTDDPEFGHRTREAARRRIPKRERERGIVPRMLRFERPLYG